MTQFFTIAPNPHWVIIDNFSKLPNGAAIYTYRSLDPSTFKPAFQDPAGMVPYGQPIVGFGNGTMPPIYWEFDSNNPSDTYYIRVYDSADTTTQQFLWDFDGISGSSGGGGGTIITAFDIENLIVNNVFYRNIGNQSGTPSLPTSLVIAPGAHEGFVNDTSNINVTDNGPVGGDIIFAKSNNSSSDSLSFIDFTPPGIHALPGQDPTPQQYLEYACTGPGSGETYKYVQFPVSQGVQNLSGQPVTLKIYARCNSGTPTLTLTWRQFFGSGGAPSLDALVPAAAPLTLTNAWKVFMINAVVPDITGSTPGSCGNDGLFLQVGFPLSPNTTNIDFIKLQIYLGTIAPSFQYDTNDQIDSLINTPRTGDTRTTINNFMPGWVQMNDGSIGDGSSNSTARANVDTFPLFSQIWNLFNASQTLAPMFNSSGSPVSYGASATADFIAHNQLSLTRNLGRAMAGALPVQVSQSFTNTGNTLTVTSSASFFTGVPVVVSGGGLPTPLVAGTTYYVIQLTLTTLQLASSYANAIASTPIVLTTNASGTVIVAAHALGSVIGDETHAMSVGEMPSHDHNIPGLIQNYCGGGASSTYNTTGPPGTTNTSFTGGGSPFNIMQPTVYMNVFIKL